MALTDPRPFQQPGVRRFGRINWLGVWTLYVKEVRRFMKVWAQTVFAPVVTTLLFLAVFSLALGTARPDVAGLPFATFLTPGLIMMAIVQNAFANTSSSIIIAKVQGNIVDILMPPLSPAELTAGFALGGLTRGLVVALATGVVAVVFIDLTVAVPWAAVYFGFGGALLMSLVGILGGIWAVKFDHLQAVTNFVITPLAFLSGTFYSLRDLPESVYVAAQLNPFFYMIDGFRYGMTGHADGNIVIGALVIGVIDVALVLASYWMIRRGYRLKS